MKLGSRVAAVVLFCLSLIVALAMAEGAVRLFARYGGPLGGAIGQADPMGVKVRPHGAFGYRPKPSAVFGYSRTRAYAHVNPLGYRGPMVRTPKTPGTIRIVLFGESTTFGWSVEDSQTIDTYMRRAYEAQDPPRHIEVVNLAFDGYDAYQIWQRLLSDGIGLQPDLVIVNTGVNDVRNARFPHLTGDPDPRTLLWETEMGRLRREQGARGTSVWIRVKHSLYLARVIGLIRSRRQAEASETPVPETHVYPEAVGNFALNVTRIADTLAALHIPLLLSTPPSALTMPGATAPMLPRSYWLSDAISTQHYRDTLATRLLAITQRGVANAAPIAYVHHTMPPNVFLDDCHLTPEGNQLMAADFIAAAARFLPPTPHR